MLYRFSCTVQTWSENRFLSPFYVVQSLPMSIYIYTAGSVGYIPSASYERSLEVSKRARKTPRGRNFFRIQLSRQQSPRCIPESVSIDRSRRDLFGQRATFGLNSAVFCEKIGSNKNCSPWDIVFLRALYGTQERDKSSGG